ncbi:MAG TPA: hypothetical protein VFO29_04435 [Candidatus Rubrimentiphilum sp.]|nr:hypothetical protein [Candidatus Rubrimentiphilum sp.]
MTAGYRAEAGALDAEILSAIAQRSVEDFDDLALRIFAHQLRYNKPYSQYCERLGVTLQAMPERWDGIPPVPAAAFKEAILTTFDPARAQLTFRTSGTTASSSGRHYMETAALYDAALLAGFHDRFLRNSNGTFRYLFMVPNPAENPHSSLGYMMKRVAATYGEVAAEWFVEGDSIDIARFVHTVRGLQAARAPVCLGATAFSLARLLEALPERGFDRFELPAGSVVMETGGFKGRTRTVARAELYAAIEQMLGVPQDSIVSEYGMTELSSQYYDAPLPSIPQGPSIPQDDKPIPQDDKLKVAAPWLRSYAVDFDGKKVPDGIVGALVHVDLANRSSCIAVLTEDLGAVVDGGIVLIGREHGTELRGCSLDAESLRVASR